MLKNYFKQIFILGGLVLAGFTASSQVTTFEYTGESETYEVPAGVRLLHMELSGAAGYGNLGYGGTVEAYMEVTPGATLNIFVGGAGTATTGGYNGGGEPGFESDFGGGGGASDIRIGGIELTDRIIVAGGGGGSGSNCGLWSAEGGHGGGLIGESACLYSCSDCQYTGAGGSQVAGGIAGPTEHASCSGNSNGTLGNGGSNNIAGYGTGGGGGYYGGGSGCYEGAGGGSSYTHPDAMSVVHTVGTTNGNGQVIITVACEPLTVTVSAATICLGESLTLDARGSGTLTWDAGIENNIAFTPTEAGIFTYNVSSDDIEECGVAVEIEILDAPSIASEITHEDAGGDGAIDITVSGGTTPYTFDWDNDGTGDFDDTEDLTGLTNGIYIIVVKDNNECEASESIELVKHTGVFENETSPFSIYPNPTTNVFTIATEGHFSYQVIGINGDIMLNGTGIDKAEVSLSEFAKGVYFVKLKTNDKTHILEIVKK
ncbi:glycine-rich protein [Crocinitomix catalasitica]|uniref:glycine-rich protein n=1 Tax=Crocinitomix catalasitica TaxID=184607 RepID=UPI0006886365|nr:glycine-rich protein [Crocinitomix catalasitica]